MAVDMFMKIATIKGESRDDKHKDEIDVLAWSWGLSQSGSTHVGHGGGAGKVNVQDLSFTKYIDSASNALILGCCKGTHYPEVLLTVRKAGDTPLEYIKITMKEVIVASVQTGGSGGEDRLTENVTLNFGAFKFEYQPQDAKGAPEGGPKIVGWDITANKPVG
ncbi:MAG TPA: type VI secretion system tube protein Hcp [Zoogloea sp.]|jgi:type VI secretion system secreted protein Hcp|uniref:Hcp family type VI secretion system effector n=1 Tax=Zoogloea sp. TaxID=49181 RepID=UPI001B782BFC|nr:type VI secretion system tube protein Hcp [Zoogloea sp.]MBP8265832.1 type VI secretion system tube protein Hcp [Zoogloea sp.]HOB45935.1 type VI secretion system tube protein Hcp [Zoogloea sp.]HQA10511.1 type VI secretion system tube protein Hcp [Zoogloea sp.]HQE39235.1 type VI secretion system tube protein Hcp [Zoogloea sp.]